MVDREALERVRRNVPRREYTLEGVLITGYPKGSTKKDLNKKDEEE